MLDDLYRELIMDHYKRPRNRGKMESPSVEMALNNPLCGDEITLQLMLEGDVVKDVLWEGQGCSISQASASMMSEAVKNMSEEDAFKLVDNFKGMMRSEGQPHPDVQMGDLEALQGVAKFPVRIKCALLAWEALRKGLADRHGGDSPVDL